MCLIAVAWRCNARYPLVIAANRDELHERPTLMAAAWQDSPDIHGGRDLQAGGSWLAVSRRGRLAAVTNVRLVDRAPAPRSRGELVSSFLRNEVSAPTAAALGLQDAPGFGPYNLLLWDGYALVHATNRPRPAYAPLPEGVHGISNGPIDAEWPKVRRLKERLGDWLGALPDVSPAVELPPRAAESDVAPLFAALADEQGAPDEDLPDTGVGLDVERRLAPVFIRHARYGTRASTVVLVDHAGQATLMERNFGPGGQPLAQVRLDFTLQVAP